MYTYLVMFDCLVVPEPYFQHIQADSLSECWDKAYKISIDTRELSDGNFEIYKLMIEEDYIAEDMGNHEELNECPLGGDTSNDCEGCVYTCDYHYVDGDCVCRHS